jgi:hypothetical protein
MPPDCLNRSDDMAPAAVHINSRNPNLAILRGKRATLRRSREDNVDARLKLGTDAEIFRCMVEIGATYT